MDNSATMIAIIVAVVCILILLAGFLLIMVMRMSIFGLANMLLRMVTSPPEERDAFMEARSQGAARTTGGRRDLRAQANAVDFDSLVAQKRGEDTPSIRTQPLVPPTSSTLDAQSAPPAAETGRRSRRRRSDLEEDGLLDGFMPDDNDPGLL